MTQLVYFRHSFVSLLDEFMTPQLHFKHTLDINFDSLAIVSV